MDVLVNTLMNSQNSSNFSRNDTNEDLRDRDQENSTHRAEVGFNWSACYELKLSRHPERQDIGRGQNSWYFGE